MLTNQDFKNIESWKKFSALNKLIHNKIGSLGPKLQEYKKVKYGNNSNS